MKNFSKIFLFGSLLATSATLSATDLLPMQQNDYKMFTATNDNLVMEVVDTHGDYWKNYSTFLGKSEQWVWSSDESSAVYWYNESGETQLLVDFSDPVGTEYYVDIDGCTDSAVLTSKNHQAFVVAGTFNNTTLLTFNGRCTDAGLTTAVFAPEVGLIAYSKQSIMGVINTEMKTATIGNVNYPLFNGVVASAQFPTGPVLSNVQDKISAYLMIENKSANTEVFTFNSSKTFDIEIRNASGDVVNRWSANKRFLMALQTIEIPAGESKSFGGEINLVDFNGQTLDVGSYMIRIELAGSNQPESSVFTSVPFAAESPLYIDQRVTINN